MIQLHDVVKEYPNGTRALDGASMEIAERDFVFIVGPSGAGKTTLIRLLTRAELPTSGDVLVENMDVTRLKRGDISRLRRRIGVIYQDYKLLPTLTVRQNIAFVLKATGEFNHYSRPRIDETLELVGMSERTDHYPYQLSGGEQQRTAIARALVRQCPILVADEPTGNLDQEAGWETIQLLVKINALGTTVLIATHNRELVDTMRRRVIALEHGRVVRDQLGSGYVG